MSRSLKILHIEDNEADALLVRLELERHGYALEITLVDCEAQLRDVLRHRPFTWDIVLSDHQLRDLDSFEAFHLLKAHQCDLPFIIISGAIGEETAAEAMRLGAQDFVMKGHLARLVPVIERELQDARQRREKQNAEMALNELNQVLLATFEQAAVGIAHVDADGKWIKANRKLLTMVGYSFEELQQMTFADITYEADVEKNLTQYRKILNREITQYTMEKRYIRKDGTLLWVNISVSGIWKEDGKLNFIMAVIEDISERKRTEAALIESEERFRTMADSSPVMIWVAGENGEIYYWNQTWLDFVGRPLAEEIPDGWKTHLHPEDGPICYEGYSQALRERRPFMTETRVKRFDGDYRWLITTGVPLFSANGQFTGFVGSCVDITEIKQAKETAETANKRKSQFLATMSHELRTPLNSVIGYSEMILKGMANTPEKQQKYATAISYSGRHLLDMVNDILDISKIEAGKLQISVEPIDVRPFVGNVEKVLYQLAQKKQVTLKFNIHPDVTCIEADPARLRQILINLINNAIKFNKAHGRVDVTLNKIMSQGTAWLQCEIHDTGKGIPEDKMHELFTDFYQVDNSTSRIHEGSGLGLALTRRLVELQGGTISAVSRDGQGSTFTFHIPMRVTPVHTPVVSEPVSVI